MELTSSMCRAQEAVQRDRAESAALENVRMIAERAAGAWHREAIAADHREARRARARTIAEIANVQNQRLVDDEDVLSENPDRGRARI
jgi:hypothetical protein